MRPLQGEEDGRVHEEIDREREQPVEQPLPEQRRGDDLVDDERGADEENHRHHDGGDELQPHAAGCLRAFFLRQRRPQCGIQPAPDQGVGGVQAGEQDSGDDGGGEQVRDRHLQHRPHDHQHDRRRNQDPQRAAGGDGAGREPHVVARPVHGLRGHDAEDRHRRADDAGGGREDGGDEEHRDVERSAGAGEHELDGAEQPLHQPRLLHQDAHEDEQRHRRERLLQHDVVELQRHEVDDELRPESPGPEHEPQEDEGEGDRETDEDREQHHRDHDEADGFGAHVTATGSSASRRRTSGAPKFPG